MSVINKVLNTLLGNKSERDIKEIEPYVGKVNAETERVEKLDNDGLRAETHKIRDRMGSGHVSS